MVHDAYRSTDFALPVPERALAYLASITTDPAYNGFDTLLLRNITLLSVNIEQQEISYEFTVRGFMCNKDGNLHGGAASALFDNLSSTALVTISRPGFWSHFGVTRSLSVIYHRPLPLGVKVRMTCSVVTAGKRMATVRATMVNEEGAVCASCVHEKFAALGQGL